MDARLHVLVSFIFGLPRFDRLSDSGACGAPFQWRKSVQSLGEVITFQPFPEWKLHLVNNEMANEPLSFLDQSFFVNEFATLSTGETLGLSGQIFKVSQVTEGSSIMMLISGLLFLGFQRTFFRSKVCDFRRWV